MNHICFSYSRQPISNRLRAIRLSILIVVSIGLTGGAAMAQTARVTTSTSAESAFAVLNRQILPPASGTTPRRRLAEVRAAARRAGLTQQGGTLTGVGEADGQQFGGSVDISADGNTAVVGAEGADSTTFVPGAAWIFTRSNGVWSAGPKLTEPDKVDGKSVVSADFGLGVAISGDGNTVFVADPDGETRDANGTGMVWVFTRSGSSWTPGATPLEPNAGTDNGFGEFGTYMAISTDGTTAVMSGQEGTDVFWVFTKSGSDWAQQGSALSDPSWATDEDHIWDLALSTDGSTALVGTPIAGDNGNPSATGSAWVFSRTGTTWSEQGPSLMPNNQSGSAWFGGSVSLSGDGNTALIGGPEDKVGGVMTGAAWIFTRSKGKWTQAATLHAKEATTEAFGAYVGISSDGTEAIIAAGNSATRLSEAIQFKKSGSDWAEQGSPVSPKGETADLGLSSMALAKSGSTVILADDAENSSQGAAWVFVVGGITVNVDGDEPDFSSALAQGECDTDAAKPGDQCTLRAAIDLLNATPATAQTVDFNIPGSGVPVITLKSALPAIKATGSTLDATTQSGGWVRLVGSSVKAANTNGLSLMGGGATVRGFVIGGFTGSGIAITGKPGGNTIQGNRIGTNAAGTEGDANGIGVSVTLSPGNTIGGTTASEGNLISGNLTTINNGSADGGIGVLLNGNSAQNNLIEGNDIGTKVNGKGSLPNDLVGVEVLGAGNNVVGGQTTTPGVAPGNVIAGGTQKVRLASGILIGGGKSDASGNRVAGNRVGIDADGTLLPQTVAGVMIAGKATNDTVGGASAGDRNIVTGAIVEDIDVESTEASNISILNNWVGTNAKGTTSLAGPEPTGGGIRAAGATGITIGSAAAGNVVVTPGSDAFGIDTDPHAIAICGCYPGGDENRNGKSLDTIAGNRVGHLPLSAGDQKDPSTILGPPALFGIADVGGSGDTIGPGNMVDWTSLALSLVNTSSTRIIGNAFGVTAGGAPAEPNGNGIALVGTTDTVVGGKSRADVNVVSNFGDGGIWIVGSTGNDEQTLKAQGLSPQRNTGAIITHNGISSDAFADAATPPRGEVLQFIDKDDKGVGIIVSAGAEKTTIGGTGSAGGNVIGLNKNDGILVQGSSFDADPTGTVIEGNNIGVGSNGTTPLQNGKLGVSIGVSDVQVGGTAAGAGNLIANNISGVAVGPGTSHVAILSNSMWSNIFGIVETKPPVPAPKITSVKVAQSGSMTVTNEVKEQGGIPETIQVFSTPKCSDDEGKTLLASQTVTPTGSGIKAVSITAKGATKGTAIVSTVTQDGFTSEFSSCVEAS